MILFNINRLEKKISENDITEKEGFRYFISLAIVTTLYMVLFYVATKSKTKPSNPEYIIYQLFHLAIIIAAAIYAFKINTKIDNKHFFSRFYSLSFVIFLRLLFYIFTIGIIAILFINPYGFLKPFLVLVIRYIVLIVTIIFNLLLIASFRRISKLRKGEIVERKTKLNVKRILLITVFIFISLSLFHYCSNAYHGSWKKSKNYMWIFKDSIKNKINTDFSFSWYRKSDVCSYFIYNGHYPITVWDFKDLPSLELNNITINSHTVFKKIEIGFGKGVILNPNSNPKVAVNFGATFLNKLKINLDDSSKIIRTISTKNYKGFYGIINRMTLTNSSNKDCIQFLYPDGPIPTLLILYKKNLDLYLIKVESNDNAHYKFDENILKIFNLKNSNN